MGKGRSQETSADSGQVLKLLIHHYNFLCITYLNSDWGPAPTGRSGSHSRWREKPATGSGEPCSRRPKARGPCSRRPKAGGETSQSLRTNSRLPRPKAAGRQAGLNRWEILVVVLLVFACVGPVLPVVAMVVKLLTETREEEEGEWQEKKNILSSVMVFYVWLHYENKDLVASMILKIFQ